MLVLSRKTYERICIGDSIIMTVVDIKPGLVRLAFEAPEEVVIDRAEIRDRRQSIVAPRRLKVRTS
jgi:carbon storage regulator